MHLSIDSRFVEAQPKEARPPNSGCGPRLQLAIGKSTADQTCVMQLPTGLLFALSLRYRITGT